MRRIAVRVAMGLVVVAGLFGQVAAGGGDTAVLPVTARPHGLSYGEWSARHWQWTYSLPADGHPLTDTADAGTGQSGRVWFLGGTFAPSDEGGGLFVGRVTRTCTVPAGTSLFFPLVSAEASVLEGNGTTEDELRGSAKFLGDFIDPGNLFLEVDWRSVSGLAVYRVQSPLFTFGPLPAVNLLGNPDFAGASSPAVSDGVYVMLPPLSAGTHTLRFGGVIDADLFGLMFVQDITYHLTVRPGR